jgi:ATP-dependent helicase/nuclease subunit B
VFYHTVAQHILTRHAQAIPDLRGITVLLPNMHAAQPLARALVRAAGTPVLLLPQMVTLNEWANSVPLDAPIAADSQRSALLYQQLRKLQWFGQADLWGMTQELLRLFDELTLSLTQLPTDAQEFSTVVQRAYQARQNQALQLEARLVFELWHAMQQGVELDAARAYQQRLAKLAQQAQRPLYVLRTSTWDAVEQRFLEECAQRVPVQVFDVREMEQSSFLSHGRGKVRMGVELPNTNIFAPSLPLQGGGNLRFFAATSLEQEARAAAIQVRRWLAAGKCDIAIVAQDRVAARRTRALLERAEILVADETGWTFATLSVSTVLDRWFTALQSDFYHHDLLDLLKSPFIFADQPVSARKSAVFQLEQLLRQHNVIEGLAQFIALTVGDVSLSNILQRLQTAAVLLAQGKKRTLAEWLSALHDSLQALGIDAGLQQDEAGQQLLHALQTWQQELQGDGGRYHLAEWRRWLAQQLDSTTFRDTGIDSPVRFTHLVATRWRSFDAVLLLGCDVAHLPSVADAGSFFNDAVRSALNLPTRAFHAQRQRDDLHALLAMNDTVLVSWQKEEKGEPLLLSPYLQLLRDARETVPGELDEIDLHTLLVAEDAREINLPQALNPAPFVPVEAVPQSVSISAYNALVACPYQFYARHILKLNELDEVQEGIEKRDYGERVHVILQRFHEQYPVLAGHDVQEMEAVLRAISETAFSDLLQQNFEAHGWLARWLKSLPAYLEWQAENEAQGWHYAEAEKKLEMSLDDVQLRGRIDRLDKRGLAMRVLDYKTQSDQLLRNKLKEPGEDVQLACYAYSEGAQEAAFVSIENGKVKAVVPPHDIEQLAQLNAQRLQQVVARIRGGAGLPANGVDEVCRYCEMRGVCRKGEWIASTPSPLVGEGGGEGEYV